MKRHFAKKYIFTLLFLLLLFVFSGVNFYQVYPALKTYVGERSWSNASEFVAGMEAVIDEQVYRKYAFVEFFGFTEKVLGSNVENGFDYVRAKDGELYYSHLEDGVADIPRIMGDIEKIRAKAEANGAETLLFIAPQKYIEGESEFAWGVPYSDCGDALDTVAKEAERRGLACLDSRDYLTKIKEETGKSVFYNTDHHWRTEAGFYMYDVLLKTLQESWKEELNPGGFYTNLNNYNIYAYENCFLGSMGRETGVVYAGLDDFTLMYPKFETDYTREYRMKTGGGWEKKEGTTYESLLSIHNLNDDGPVYQGDKYGTYLNAVNVEDRITNHLNSDGPRVLMIRDSFMAVPGVFLAQNCSQLDLLWSINYDGDLRALIEQGDYDYVIIQISGSNINNEQFLEFINF